MPRIKYGGPGQGRTRIVTLRRFHPMLLGECPTCGRVLPTYGRAEGFCGYCRLAAGEIPFHGDGGCKPDSPYSPQIIR